MSYGPAAIWTPPPLRPPRVSLLTAAYVFDESEVSEDEAQYDRLGNGYRYLPEPCGTVGLIEVCGDTDITPDDSPGARFIPPFGVYGASGCSTFGSLSTDFHGRARRALHAGRSKQIESQLWDNVIGISEFEALSVVTADDITPTGGAVPIVDGLRRLEDAITSCSTDGDSVIHVTPYALGFLVEARLVRWEQTSEDGDGRYRTYMGHTVASGYGYPGTGPNGEARSDNNEWMYATGAVYIHLGRIQDIPEADQPGQAIKRLSNDIEVRAQQLVTASFEDCCHLAVEVQR